MDTESHENPRHDHGHDHGPDEGPRDGGGRRPPRGARGGPRFAGDDRPRGRKRNDWEFDAARRGHPGTTASDRTAIEAWFAGNLTDGWFLGPAHYMIDDYEIVVVGDLAQPEVADEAQRTDAELARIERFRADTRERRIEIARDAEARFARKVSWGATVGSTSRLFTTTSVPVMTRLHMRHRRVLDTLVDAGVARSRSEALAWCVELVGRNETEWIATLQRALDDLAAAREGGPGSP
jgi:hypothetical protein